MKIEVLKNNKPMFEGEADELLEAFNYDLELEELLNELDIRDIGSSFKMDIFGYELNIEKLADENIYN